MNHPEEADKQKSGNTEAMHEPIVEPVSVS